MNSLATDQILILFLQCIVASVIILVLFRIRTIFGLSLFYIALGVFKYMHFFLTKAFSIELISGIQISMGSTVLFTVILFSILLVYIREDALEARKVIYGLIIANLVFAIIQYAASWGFDGQDFINIYHLPKTFLSINIKVFLIGSLLIFIDSFIIIYIYETISRRIKFLYLRILFTMSIVLSIHALLFSFGVFFGTNAFQNALTAGLISKIIPIIVSTSLFWIYLQFIEKRKKSDIKISGQFRDVFDLFTYRQKFELVYEEKLIQDIELENKNDFIETLIKTIPDLVWLKDINGVYLKCNAEFERLFGAKEADIIGKTDYDFVDNDLADFFRRNDLIALEANKPMSNEEFLTYADGGYQGWFETTKTPMQNKNGGIVGVLGIARNINERKQAEKELRESEEKLDLFFSQSLDGFFFMMLDEPIVWNNSTNKEKALDYIFTNQRITKANKAVLEQYKATEEQFIGRTPNDLFAHNIKYGRQVWKDFFDSGQLHIDTFEKKFDGTDMTIEGDYICLYDSLKRIRGHFGIQRDVTPARQTEEELKKYRSRLEEIVKARTHELEISQAALLNLVDDLNRQSSELEKSNLSLNTINAELETFTYSISHDLKAPLRGIDGYSQLLLDNFNADLKPEAQEFIRNIRKGAKQMNTLIEDLLAYSRMERLVFQPEKVHFRVLIDNLLLYYSKTITENNIELKLDVPETFMLSANKEGLNLVMRNLIDNAIKFTSKSKNPTIEIRCSEDDLFWRIFVKDNGIGFEMKYHDRIYNIFQRLHLAEEYEGTGIGLAMVSKAIHRMNGKVWAESEPSNGACFYLEIKKIAD